jgi:hypothetical protein
MGCNTTGGRSLDQYANGLFPIVTLLWNWFRRVQAYTVQQERWS